MSYRSVWNYCMIHVCPTCAKWQGDDLLSHTENHILHACVLQNPLRQERNADSIRDAVPPLPSAFIKLKLSSAPGHHSASRMSCGAHGQVQEASGSFLRTANTANQQCHWHSMRQLYIQSVTEIHSCSTTGLSLYRIYWWDFHLWCQFSIKNVIKNACRL